MSEPTLVRFRRVVATAHALFDERREEVNDLNVFPVADGDTGDNMALTLAAVLRQLETLSERSVEEIGRDEIVEAVAHAALMGARGNSGVILSQVVRGAAEELASRPGELIDPVLITAAFGRAADAAYDSVRNPAEGTILTVVREMAHAVAAEVAHMGEWHLSHHSADAAQDAMLARVLEAAVTAGNRAVERTTGQLEVLEEAGVVDAGAHGLVLILAGMVAGLRGDVAEAPDVTERDAAAVLPAGHDLSDFRYCTNFVVSGAQPVDQRAAARELERIGDSVLVVGDAGMVRIHVHTDDPQQATALFSSTGTVSDLEVADMNDQIAARAHRLAASGPQESMATAFVAVCSGPGLCSLFGEMGALPLDGGATMNPSTDEILGAIAGAGADEVVVLPNSPNVVMAAERAAELADTPVHVIDCTSQQAGLVAMVEVDPRRPGAENVKRLRDALDTTRVGAVAPAARDDVKGRFERGDAVGFVDDEIAVWGAAEETLNGVIEALRGHAEIITLVGGDQAPVALDELHLPGDIDVEAHEGGQQHYWWLVAAQ
ncbi:MAG: DAK2 domain-containing protein [Solirubrobacterales bacterium]